MEDHWSDLLSQIFDIIVSKSKALAGSRLSVNLQHGVDVGILPLLLTVVGLDLIRRGYVIILQSLALSNPNPEVQEELKSLANRLATDMELLEPQENVGTAAASSAEPELSNHHLHGEKSDDYNWENFDWEEEPVIYCSCPKLQVNHNLDLR